MSSFSSNNISRCAKLELNDLTAIIFSYISEQDLIKMLQVEAAKKDILISKLILQSIRDKSKIQDLLEILSIYN